MKKLWNLFGAITLGAALAAPWGALDARVKECKGDDCGWYGHMYRDCDPDQEGDEYDLGEGCWCGSTPKNCRPCEWPPNPCQGGSPLGLNGPYFVNPGGTTVIRAGKGVYILESVPCPDGAGVECY